MKRLKSNRQVGLHCNDICPHCSKKVRITHYILPSMEANLTGYWVEHWWSDAQCENFTRLSDVFKQDIK